MVAKCGQKPVFTVPNLSPIPLEVFNVFAFAYVLFSVVVVVNFWASIPMVIFELFEKSVPDLFPSLVV